MFGFERLVIIKSKACGSPKLLGRHVAPFGMTGQRRQSFLWVRINDLAVNWLHAAMFSGIYFHRSMSIVGNERSEVVSSSGQSNIDSVPNSQHRSISMEQY